MNRSAILKSIAACVVAAAVLTDPMAAAVEPIALLLRVDNVAVGEGPVLVAVYERESWLSETAAFSARLEPQAASVVARLQLARPGRYGVAVYQDRNADGRLNRNIIGLPSEPVAFSNAAVIQFGPPSFDDAAIDVSGERAEATVRLR